MHGNNGTSALEEMLRGITESPHYQGMSITLNDHLKEEVESAAEAIGLDASTFINVAVTKALNSVKRTGKLTVGIEG